jgi:hypothetical protein
MIPLVGLVDRQVINCLLVPSNNSATAHACVLADGASRTNHLRSAHAVAIIQGICKMHTRFPCVGLGTNNLYRAKWMCSNLTKGNPELLSKSFPIYSSALHLKIVVFQESSCFCTPRYVVFSGQASFRSVNRGQLFRICSGIVHQIRNRR